MDARELRTLREARGLSQRTAALDWGVDPHTVYRWEAGLRPIPMWIDRMFERERPLLRRIESQEREIAALLLKLYRMPDARPERFPIGVARLGTRLGAARGGRRAHV